MYGPTGTHISERQNFDLKKLFIPLLRVVRTMNDAHFSIAKSLIKHFLNDRQVHEIVTEDLIEALTFENGFPNTAIELIKLMKNYDGLKSCLVENCYHLGV